MMVKPKLINVTTENISINARFAFVVQGHYDHLQYEVEIVANKDTTFSELEDKATQKFRALLHGLLEDAAS